jgi:putative membrane protein
MRSTRLLTLPALLALAFAFGGAQAQTMSTATPAAATHAAPAKKLDHKDRKFVQNAAEAGMFEVQVGQLAVSKATDPQVKSFAQMLVEQHTQANNELTQIANAKGVEMPAAPKHSQRREIEKLGKRNGADFDQHFVKEAGIKAHKKTIKEFEKAAKDLKDPDLKAFAQKTLPVLQNHLAAAEKLPESGQNAAAMGASKK